MTDEEFAAGVDEILEASKVGHESHRALDMLWTRYAVEKGGPLASATLKWMAAIEGDHDPARPYPLGAQSWWQKPLACKFGRHDWLYDVDTGWLAVWARQCRRCAKREGSGNPCP